MQFRFKYILLIWLNMFFFNCDRGPKIIHAPVNNANTYDNERGSNRSTGIFDGGSDKVVSSGSQVNSQMSDVHSVVVNEVLPTQKYVYLNVSEGEETYWIATIKQVVEVGQQYYFKGGLLKTNFESVEYNRVFDKVYLVSKVVPMNHGQKDAKGQKAELSKIDDTPNKFKLSFDHGEDYVKIADLVKKPADYEGKKIKMTGQCSKLNANIMGKNWIHLKDGTMDEYDLVLTSATAVPEGHIIKVEGTVVLNKDFGSGYSYPILVEDAVVINE